MNNADRVAVCAAALYFTISMADGMRIGLASMGGILGLLLGIIIIAKIIFGGEAPRIATKKPANEPGFC